MGFKMKASNTGGDFEPAPEGTHNGVCTRLVDLGTEAHPQYGERRRVQVGFEIDELRDDGQPFLISKFMTLSMHEKASLRKFLEGWRGKAYSDDEDVDITAIIGRPGLVSIVRNTSEAGKVYANIASVSGLPKGMEPLRPKGDTICLSLEPGEFDDGEFEKLHEKAQERIQATPEWQRLTSGPVKGRERVEDSEVDDDIDDPIPGFDDDKPDW